MADWLAGRGVASSGGGGAGAAAGPLGPRPALCRHLRFPSGLSRPGAVWALLAAAAVLQRPPIRRVSVWLLGAREEQRCLFWRVEGATAGVPPLRAPRDVCGGGYRTAVTFEVRLLLPASLPTRQLGERPA